MRPGTPLKRKTPLGPSTRSTSKAVRLLGYHPTRSWRDYLTPEGVLVDSARLVPVGEIFRRMGAVPTQIAAS